MTANYGKPSARLRAGLKLSPCLIPLGILILQAIVGCGGMPSDLALRDRFRANQSDYDRLIKMSNEDSRVVVVKDNFTYLDTDASWPRKDIGFSEERWSEYKQLFRKLGIEGGISRRRDLPNAVFVEVYGHGGVLASSSKGYVYSQTPLPQLVQSLDLLPRDFGSSGHAIAFASLAKDWYLYREEY